MSPARPFKPHPSNDAMSQKRAPHRLSLPTQKSLYQQDSSQVVSRQQKVSFIKPHSLKENKAVAKYVGEAHMIGNKDIYKQVALSPSRAPEIIFGNLRHNQMQYRQNLLNQQETVKLAAAARKVERRASRPWGASAEAKKPQQ